MTIERPEPSVSILVHRGDGRVESLSADRLDDLDRLLVGDGPSVATEIMVPTLIAGIYGMNFDRMPELGWDLGYPFALGLMVLAAAAAIAFFRRVRWF